MHNGKNGTWLGNTRIMRATKVWLEFDDASHQRALFHTEVCLIGTVVLAEKLVHPPGKDYQMRIHKLLRRLEWVSKTIQFNTHKESTNFLSLNEALCIDELINVERPSNIREGGT